MSLRRIVRQQIIHATNCLATNCPCDELSCNELSGHHPSAVASADFNHDSLLDLVAANEGTDSIGILIAYNYISFQSQITFSSNDSLGPLAVVVSDVNNDTYLDIAATFSLADKIGIFLGCGNGTFTTMMVYSTGDRSQPFGIALGDFNNDGRWDIVVANWGTNNVGVLLGYGNGSFAAIITYSTGNDSLPMAVVVGDINNDNRLDIVVANSGTDNIGILLGYGNGILSVVTTYSTGVRSRPCTIAIGDFNNDNISDIAVANSGISNIFLLYGYGNGTFGNQTSYSLGYEYLPYSIAVKDLNEDNWMDIAIACYGTDHVETLIQMC